MIDCESGCTSLSDNKILFVYNLSTITDWDYHCINYSLTYCRPCLTLNATFKRLTLKTIYTNICDVYQPL